MVRIRIVQNQPSRSWPDKDTLVLSEKGKWWCFIIFTIIIIIIIIVLIVNIIIIIIIIILIIIDILTNVSSIALSPWLGLTS